MKSEDFPILAEMIHGKPLVYLDNAATTQKPQCVIDAIVSCYTHTNSNVHRGVHHLSQIATKKHEDARRTIQHFINAKSEKEILFTRGTTESINLLAATFGQRLQAGDEVIISEMEHHSNIVPWQLLEMNKGIKVRVVPISDVGELDMDAYRKLFNDRTRMVSIVHVSNVLGTINPIKEIISIAHEHGVYTHVDGAQSIAHLPIDVQDLDCDFFSFSGHKIYGPTGIGVLYGRESVLETLPPYQGGGEMIDHVSFEGTTFNELPYRFEAGTPNYVGSVGLATAIDYVSAIGMDKIQQYEHELTVYAVAKLSTISGIRFIGDAAHREGVISFLVDNIHPFDMGTLIDHLGFALRTGHHCAQPLMKHFGIEGTLRASFGLYNTHKEIDDLITALIRVQKMF
ncbi:MAG: cysteine desulfurase [Bacteroidaceae bacterium]